MSSIHLRQKALVAVCVGLGLVHGKQLTQSDELSKFREYFEFFNQIRREEREVWLRAQESGPGPWHAETEPWRCTPNNDNMPSSMWVTIRSSCSPDNDDIQTMAKRLEKYFRNTLEVKSSPREYIFKDLDLELESHKKALKCIADEVEEKIIKEAKTCAAKHRELARERVAFRSFSNGLPKICFANIRKPGSLFWSKKRQCLLMPHPEYCILTEDQDRQLKKYLRDDKNGMRFYQCTEQDVRADKAKDMENVQPWVDRMVKYATKEASLTSFNPTFSLRYLTGETHNFRVFLDVHVIPDLTRKADLLEDALSRAELSADSRVTISAKWNALKEYIEEKKKTEQQGSVGIRRDAFLRKEMH